MHGRGFDPRRPDESFVQLFHAEDQIGDAFADRFPHLIEQPHAFAFVFDLGIHLGVAHEADALRRWSIASR